MVETPAFVFGCGDITEWPTNAAMKTYESLLTKRLKYPAYDVIGNHDEGGKSPSDTMRKWLIARHGALTYTFESQGVRFVALYSAYDESLNNPAQPLTRQALDDLRQQLAQREKSQPTIVATHLCLDALTNKDELIDVLAPFNILAILGGHYHKATVQSYRGRPFVQLPSPAPNGPRAFTVFRITPRSPDRDSLQLRDQGLGHRQFPSARCEAHPGTALADNRPNSQGGTCMRHASGSRRRQLSRVVDRLPARVGRR